MSIPGNANPLLLASAAADAAAAGPTRSLRFNSGDTAYLSKTFGSAGNRRTWTVSFWIKKVKNDSGANFYRIFGQENATHLYFYQDNINFDISNSGTTIGRRWTSQVFRDNSAWFHVVAVCNTPASTASERMRLYINGSEVTAFGNTTNPSQNADTAMNTANQHTIGYRTSTQGSAGGALDAYIADFYFIDGSALDPTSFGAFDDNGVWQAAAYSGTFGTNGFHLLDFANESTVGHDSSGNDNDFTANNITTGNTFSTNMTPSDTAYPNTTLSNGGLSWSGSTANDTGTVSSLTIPTNKKTYVEVTHTTTGGGDPGPGVAQGPTTELGLDSVKAWWRGGTNGSITVSTLGSFTGTNTSWSNGDVLGIALDNTANSGAGSITFYKNGTQIHTGGSGWTSYTDLRFEWQNNGSNTSSGTWNYGASAFSYPVSGHTGLFEGSGADEDVLFDVPTNGTQSETGAGGEVSANYCTLNPLDKATVAVLSDGNLRTNSSGTGAIRGTFKYPKTGKWYYEVEPIDDAQYNTGYFHVGIATANANLNTNPGYDTTNEFTYWQNGSKTNNVAYGASFTAGDIIGVAFDAGAGSLTFYKNGVSQGVNSTGLTGEYFPYAPTWNYNAAYNFGQRPFAYPVSNYLPLSTTNLPTPTIADGSDYFDAKLHVGNGSTQTISGFEFSPDFVWVKQRNTSRDHRLANTISGTGKDLRSNANNAEVTDANGITAFNSDGFSVGSSTGWNQSSGTYVSWCWDAGSSTVSNTDGSITSNVRANTTAGFSIVSWTSSSSVSTVGHGLSDAPYFIVTKNRSTTNAWWSYHFALGNTKAIRLDTSDGASTMSSTWNNTSPTNSVFTVGGEFGNGNNMIAYCFAPVAGYSAFGSYAGNSSSDGPFNYTGFRVAWLLVKKINNTDSNSGWHIYDKARNEFNPLNNFLLASHPYYENRAANNTADVDSYTFDFVSNGFLPRHNSNNLNRTGSDYIWAAFAENPFQANGGLAR